MTQSAQVNAVKKIMQKELDNYKKSEKMKREMKQLQ